MKIIIALLEKELPILKEQLIKIEEKLNLIEENGIEFHHRKGELMMLKFRIKKDIEIYENVIKEKKKS